MFKVRFQMENKVTTMRKIEQQLSAQSIVHETLNAEVVGSKITYQQNRELRHHLLGVNEL